MFFVMIRDGIKGRGWVLVKLRNVTQEKNFKFIHHQLTLCCVLAYAAEIALIFIHVLIFAKKYFEKKGRFLCIS